MRILVLNGPNIDRLGQREPEVYGHRNMDALKRLVAAEARELGVAVVWKQSNREGELVEMLHDAFGGANGVVFNPTALTHTSVALLDAVLAIDIPVLEVHLSNTLSREPTRRPSLVGRGVWARIEGMGADSYVWGLRALVNHLKNR